MTPRPNPRLTTRDLTLIPLFTVLTAAGAFVRIPLGPVPISLQFIFVALSGILLGRKGGLAQGLYLLLGLLGLPIFTGGGGIGYIFTPTFGYLVGFVAAATLIGALRESLGTVTVGRLTLASLAGLLVLYAFGVTWLYVLMNLLLDTPPLSLAVAIRVGALVFLLGDTLWCVVAAIVGTRLLKALSHGASQERRR